MNQYVGMKSSSGEAGFVDFRSEAVTKPSDEMKQAAMECPLGDDVYGVSIDRMQGIMRVQTDQLEALYEQQSKNHTILAEYAAGLKKQGYWQTLSEILPDLKKTRALDSLEYAELEQQFWA